MYNIKVIGLNAKMLVLILMVATVVQCQMAAMNEVGAAGFSPRYYLGNSPEILNKRQSTGICAVDSHSCAYFIHLSPICVVYKIINQSH